jgi:hypothetical protein
MRKANCSARNELFCQGSPNNADISDQTQSG